MDRRAGAARRDAAGAIRHRPGLRGGGGNRAAILQPTKLPRGYFMGPDGLTSGAETITRRPGEMDAAWRPARFRDSEKIAFRAKTSIIHLRFGPAFCDRIAFQRPFRVRRDEGGGCTPACTRAFPTISHSKAYRGGLYVTECL